MRYFGIILMFLLVSDCSRVPITGRRQMNMLPESQLMSMSLTQYRSFLSENKTIAAGDSKSQMVKDIGAKISKAVEIYLRKHKQSKRIANYKWEFNLVDDPTVNAWCMPGGKVVVYSGLLGVTQNETALAVVMGHEIAHAIARHGNERMSQALLLQGGGIALNLAMTEKPELTRNILLQSYGIGSTLGSLKYSRVHETEADKMGLIFMAMAGYDPREAIAFWQRMAAQGGAKVPEFLSTHPHDDTRAKTLNEFMPEALKYYTVKK